MMKIQVAVFWVVMPHSDVVEQQCFGGTCCHCHHLQGEDGGSMVGILPHHYTVSQPRRL
jgi:hypothetical protein